MVINEGEKRGGLPFRPSEVLDFLNFMSVAGVSDAGFSGSRYTWCNNRSGAARIWKRLDRLLLSGRALELQHQVMVQHLVRDPSNHSPLLLSVVTRLDNKPMPFHFLNVWTTHHNLLGAIKDCWFQSISGARRIEHEVVDAEMKYDLDPTDHLRCELYHARAQLRRALAIEEGFWRQKAQVKWLLDGDRNSKYFHSLVAEKRRRAVIHRVRKTDGEWIEGEPQIGDIAVRFFQELFMAKGNSTSNAIPEIIPKLVTNQDNSLLTEIPSLTKVKTTVFAMDEESAAGPDGFTGKFFTFAWEVLRHFGFNEIWIDMIWRLISNVWFSVLVNGAPQDFVKSSRGCPLYVGRRKKVYYADTCNAVAARILSWKNQILSVGGRVVLIKSVLSSMPIHLLAAASPPKGILMALEKLFTNFLWGSSDSEDKFHWMRWEDLSRPREEGVLVCGIERGQHPCLADEGHQRSHTWRRMVVVQRVGEDNIS
nr:uncharacterized protein LOC113729178 [Coffea arabica]